MAAVERQDRQQVEEAERQADDADERSSVIRPSSATWLKTAPTPTTLETCSRASWLVKTSPKTWPLALITNHVKSRPWSMPPMKP